MRVSLKYGAGRVPLTVPPGLAARHEAFAAGDERLPELRELGARARAELGAAGLGAAIAGQHVGLLVADGTREPTQEELLPDLAPLLAGAARVTLLVCTGTHDPELPENRALRTRLERLLGELGLAAEVVVHDAERSPLVALGRTGRGTPVEVSARADACGAFLAVANMKHHYFAGYSNPAKYLIPGLASVATARANHALTFEDAATFGRHPWHRDPLRRENPLAADMVEGVELFLRGRPLFAACALGGAGKLVWAGGGLARDAAARGMDEVDRRASLALPPARFLVVSPGGHPHDESMYTAQRALELSRAAVQDGGEVLFLARCPNGIGTPAARANFFEPLTRPLAEVCRRPPGEYVMYSHKSYKFGLYLTRLAAVHVHSDLPAAEVRAMHLRPAPSAQDVLDDWGRRARPGDAVTLIDDASRFAVVAAEPEAVG